MEKQQLWDYVDNDRLPSPTQINLSVHLYMRKMAQAHPNWSIILFKIMNHMNRESEILRNKKKNSGVNHESEILRNKKRTPVYKHRFLQPTRSEC